ncbi:MAG: c-type cytochrome [Rhodospirillaceae bacterium]|nr:c-type cytochrome [Rhodospirillaceae bacterium]MBL6932047.1 c-type cytochrome [Rhodospirillales bacterium]
MKEKIIIQVIARKDYRLLKKRNKAVALFSLLAALMVSSGARAECDGYPSVSWWGELTHNSVSTYVDSRHGGEWGAYNNKWKRQLDKLKEVYAKGGSVVTPNGAKLKGISLANYIEQVSKRISVNSCLAMEQANSKEKLTDPAAAPILAKLDEEAEVILRNDPKAGKIIAQKSSCFLCHNATGRSENPLVPNLAGQKPAYLVKQLMAFASSAEGMLPTGDVDYRYHFFMSQKALSLSRANMEDIAVYFSSLE